MSTTANDLFGSSDAEARAIEEISTGTGIHGRETVKFYRSLSDNEKREKHAKLEELAAQHESTGNTYNAKLARAHQAALLLAHQLGYARY